MKRKDEQAGDWREWRRLRAWQLYQQGWKQQEIGRALGANKGAVSQWIARGEAGGEERLRGKVAVGPRPKLSAEQEASLPTLLDQGAEAHGFSGKVGTTERVAKLIKNASGEALIPRR